MFPSTRAYMTPRTFTPGLKMRNELRISSRPRAYMTTRFAHVLYVEEEPEIFPSPKAYIEGRTRSEYRGENLEVSRPIQGEAVRIFSNPEPI